MSIKSFRLASLFLILAFTAFSYAQRLPLQETVENSARYRWENKPVLESVLLDNTELLSTWSHTDEGTMTLTTERAKDGIHSIRLSSKALVMHPTTVTDNNIYNRNSIFCSAKRVVTNQNWNNWNRVSMWIYPDYPGENAVSVYVRVMANSSSNDNIVLKNRQWNYIVSEIPTINRTSVTGIDIKFRLTGIEGGMNQNFTCDIDKVMLERVATDKTSGWAVATDKLSFSHTGYSVGSKKSAFASNITATTFSLIDAVTNQTVLTKPITSQTTYRGTYKIMDFSEFNVPGSYFIQAGNINTRPFSISPQIWVTPLEKALNFYYVLRCAYAVPGYHGVTNTDWRANGVDISGGWYDAGDLSQALYNTSEGTLIMFQLAERLRQNNTNPALLAQITDEAKWGLQWLLKVTDRAGKRAGWSVLGRWTDGIVGSADDARASLAFNATNFMLTAAAEAVAYRVLKDVDPTLAAKSLAIAEEDWGFAKTKLSTYLGSTPVCETAAAATLASIELYKSTGKQLYADQALSMSSYLTDSQQSTYIPGGEIAGFLYEKTDKTQILHSVYGSGAHEHTQIIAMAALCEAFPTHANYMKWYSGVAMYSDMYKKITNNTAPYNMLPGGVYLKNETDTDFAGMPAQLAKGQSIGDNHVVMALPANDGHFGQLHLQLSQGKGVAVGAHLRGDLDALQLAEEQMQWTLGRNPFSNSFMYGEGYDYIPLYTPMNGNVVGALPVGLPSTSVDEPVWKAGSNMPSPHEQWIQTVNRFVWLAGDLLGSTILTGKSATEVSVLNETTNVLTKMQPDGNGNFSTTIPQGKYIVTVDGMEHHVVALPNAKISINKMLDFVVTTNRNAENTKQVTITVEANGTGTHKLAIRTSNLTVLEPEKTITLQQGIKQTISWEALIPDENSPCYVVIVPDNNIAERKEALVKFIKVASVVDGSTTKILVSQDTYIDNTTPTTAKGTATSTFASYSATLSTPRIRDSYFKFVLSDFKPEDAASIKSVKLALKAGYVSDATTSQKLILRDVNKDGIDLNTLTFDGLAAAGLNAVPFYLDNSILTDFTLFPSEKQLGSKISEYEGAIAVDQVIEFDVTNYIKWAIANGKQEVNMNMSKDVSSDNGLDNRAWFHTLETTVTDAIPMLNLIIDVSALKSRFQSKNQWKLFPTVATAGNINLICENNVFLPAQIKIYSITGVMVKSLTATTSSLSFNAHDFSAGSYIVSITNNEIAENQRFIVAN